MARSRALVGGKEARFGVQLGEDGVEGRVRLRAQSSGANGGGGWGMPKSGPVGVIYIARSGEDKREGRGLGR
jgi:hypothetical protein